MEIQLLTFLKNEQKYISNIHIIFHNFVQIITNLNYPIQENFIHLCGVIKHIQEFDESLIEGLQEIKDYMEINCLDINELYSFFDLLTYY